MIRREYLLAAIAAAFLCNGSAGAVPLDPNTYASLGALPSGDFTLDTDAAVDFIGPVGTLPGIGIFTYDGGGVLASGDTITVTGSRALAILFKGSASISGTIDVSGKSILPAPNFPFGGKAVAGGYDGGSANIPADRDGGGPGGGDQGAGGNNSGHSGAGGGFGNTGGEGSGNAHGGMAYGDLQNALEGGSGGGAGGTTTTVFGGGGGAGGGAIEIGALTLLDFAGAMILADGGDGSSVGFKPGGGGSGGGLLLHAFDVTIDASSVIRANGGDGGSITGTALAGCGGAGRIAILYNTAGSLTNNGTVQAIRGSGTKPLPLSTTDCTGPDVVTTMALADIGEAPDTMPPPTGMTEPGTLALFGLGLAGLGFARRKRMI